MFDFQEETRDAATYWHEQMPAEIRDLISTARHDLIHGPVYLDDEGESVSCFDEGAKRFDFAGACATIAAWCDQIQDLTATDYCDCDLCEGRGYLDNEEFDESDPEDTPHDTCPDCDGSGYCETESTVDGSRRAVLRDILGDHLLQHI